MAEVQDNLIQEDKNWIWVYILTDYGGGELCLDVLFIKENRSTDGVQLYKRLEPEQLRICWLKNQRQIFWSIQWNNKS